MPAQFRRPALLSLAAALIIAFAALPTPALAEPVSLRAGTFLPPQAAYAKPFARWVDKVNDVCADHVAITLVGPEAIGAFEQPNALSTGILDMLGTPGTYYKGTMVEIDVLTLADVPLTEQRENGAWEKLNALHHEKMNAQYLTSYGTGINFYIWSQERSADGRFDGQRLRSSPIYETFFRALGATTVQLPPPEVYTALERGTVDGYGWPTWGISDFGWQEHTAYQHGPGFLNAMNSILVNLDRWNAMSEAARACLTEQAIWLEEVWPQWLEAQNDAEQEVVTEAGITYVDLGDDFARLAEDSYWKFLEGESPQDVPALRALVSTR